jgi:hypothetical protein
MLQPTCLKGCLLDSNCSYIVQKPSKVLNLMCHLVVFCTSFNVCVIDGRTNKWNESRDWVLV